MSTLAVEHHPQEHNVECTDVALVVELIDGRTISVPLVWFSRLASASKEQLRNWELLGDGAGIHWPDIDEDLSIACLLAGTHQRGSEPQRCLIVEST